MSQYIDGPNKTFTNGLTAYARCLRVKLSAGVLALAGADDMEIGTLVDRAEISAPASVRLQTASGTTQFVAAGTFSAGATLYGAADGKVDDVPSAMRIGIALEAATGAGDIIEAMRTPAHGGVIAVDVASLTIWDDFIGDYPAAATAINVGWTKLETNGVGVVGSDEVNGVLKFSIDTATEAATEALYMVNSPATITKGPILKGRIAIFDIGDHAALDINFGLANDCHATDFDATTRYIAFHLDGAALDILAQSYDGTTTVAATDTTVNAVDDTFFTFEIDCTDLTDVKLYINGVRVLATTAFDISAWTGACTPIVHVEKSSNDTPGDVRVDYLWLYQPTR